MRPILFNLGPVPIKAWGVMVAIAFLAGLFLAKKRAAEKGISSEKIYDLAFYLLISGLLGSRLVFVLLDAGYYFSKPLQILMVQDGGMSIHGALIGGFAAAYFYAKKNKISLLKLGDIVAPSVFLGTAIGRVGCYLNGCCHGAITEILLAVRFPSIEGLRHATQLYESFLDLIALAVVIVAGRRIKKEGTLFLISVIAYSVIRFFIEYLRDDMGYIVNGLTWGQAASLLMAGLALAAIFARKGKTSYEDKSVS